MGARRHLYWPMIIQCPACTTRYVVPETAIGVDGRTVRCAKCRHSWFQDGPDIDVEALRQSDDARAALPTAASTSETASAETAAPPVEDTADARDAEGHAAQDLPDDPPLPGPADNTPAAALRDDVRSTQEREADFGDPPASAFDHEPPFRPRRNWLKLWTWAAGIFALVAAGLIFAVSYWGLPDWVPVERPTFAVGEPDLQLDFPPDQQERRTLPNGTEFFGASGTITNIGTTTRTIPTILIVLRDSRDRIVYSWEVPPPQRTIAPGASVPVSQAVTDIPRSAREVQIGWKPE